jgi:hypothetical protein
MYCIWISVEFHRIPSTSLMGAQEPDFGAQNFAGKPEAQRSSIINHPHQILTKRCND